MTTNTPKAKRRPDFIVYAPAEGKDENGRPNTTKAGVAYSTEKGGFRLHFGGGSADVILTANRFKTAETLKDGSAADPARMAKRPDFKAIVVTKGENGAADEVEEIGAAWKLKTSDGLRIQLSEWGQSFVMFRASQAKPKFDPDTGEVYDEQPKASARKAAPSTGMNAGA